MAKKQIFVFLILGILMVAVSVWFWAGWAKLASEPFKLMLVSREVLRPGIFFLVALILFLALASLLAVLVSRWVFLIPTFLLSAVSCFIFIKFQPVLLVLPVVLFLVLLYFTWGTRRDINNHLKFSASHIFKPRFGTLLTFLALVLAFHSYFAAYGKLDQFEFKIPDFIFEKITPLIEGMMGGQGLVKGEETAQDYFGLNQLPPEAEEFFKRGEITPEMREMIKSQLPPGIPKEMADSIIDGLIQKYQQGGQVEEPSSAQEPMTGVLKAMMESQINQAVALFKPYIPVVFAVTVFFTMKYLGILLIPISIAVLALFIDILVWTKVAQKKTEMVEAERIMVE